MTFPSFRPLSCHYQPPSSLSLPLLTWLSANVVDITIITYCCHHCCHHHHQPQLPSLSPSLSTATIVTITIIIISCCYHHHHCHHCQPQLPSLSAAIIVVLEKEGQFELVWQLKKIQTELELKQAQWWQWEIKGHWMGWMFWKNLVSLILWWLNNQLVCHCWWWFWRRWC